MIRVGGFSNFFSRIIGGHLYVAHLKCIETSKNGRGEICKELMHKIEKEDSTD